MALEDYRSYRGLPPVAGICSIAEAADLGFPVDTCVSRLKRHHWAFARLHQVFVHRLTAEPIYELKMAFSLHAHYCAEHAAAWRRRVGEMREPPLGLDVVPDAALEAYFDELLAAPDTGALLAGVYEHALPALRDALRQHLAKTNRLIDHPSVRICRFALLEVDEMVDYGARAVDCLLSAEARGALAPWLSLLDRLLAQAGGLDGSHPVEQEADGRADAQGDGEAYAQADGQADGSPERLHSVTPYVYAREPRRDARFRDPYNMGVHAEAFLYDETLPPEPKTLMMYYKRLREIDVPEMMASILAETTRKPWAYTVDMTRQLWDEARHAMMGEVGFARIGVDWPSLVRVNFTWSLALNTQLTPLERHAVLYFIEQGLMPRTGKRFEWETALASGDRFSALAQDYDWADEVLHARIGRDWYVPDIGDQKQAIAYGGDCWSKVLMDWTRYRDEGLTTHENWWPALYDAWCRQQGRAPDPVVAAFDTTYETVRADLREISTSG